MSAKKKKRIKVPSYERTYDPKKAPPRNRKGQWKKKERQGRLF